MPYAAVATTYFIHTPARKIHQQKFSARKQIDFRAVYALFFTRLRKDAEDLITRFKTRIVVYRNKIIHFDLHGKTAQRAVLHTGCIKIELGIAFGGNTVVFKKYMLFHSSARTGDYFSPRRSHAPHSDFDGNIFTVSVADMIRRADLLFLI